MVIYLEKRKDKIMPGSYGSYSNKQKKIAKMLLKALMKQLRKVLLLQKRSLKVKK